ncbi:hypothetical protein LDY98_26055, partial [Pseudomonas aeruginosa]|nr:hypothetical protein [Pseudomonas aeruginosa]
MIAFALACHCLSISTMPFRKHLLLPLLGLALLLGGCGPSVSYSYIPPTSDAGLHCVTQCNAEKRQCKTLAKLQQRQVGGQVVGDALAQAGDGLADRQ